MSRKHKHSWSDSRGCAELARAVAATCIALALTAAPPMAPAQTAARPSDDQIVNDLMAWMRKIFELSPTSALDAQTRSAVSQMAQEHLERVPTVLRGWLAAESDEADSTTGRQQRVFARVANELALWRLQSDGPEHDAAWLVTMERPNVCRHSDPAISYFERLALMWQSAPASHRIALLKAERAVLARWGATARAPARPVPSAEDELRAAMEGSGRVAASALPMTPLVATVLLKDGAHWRSINERDRCAVLQWWLRGAHDAAGAARADRLLAWRYATMPSAELWFGGAQAAKEGSQAEYPDFARRWLVEGSIAVEIRAAGSGSKGSERIVARRVSVPGIRGQRAVAFETALDDASLARAAALDRSTEPARRVEFVWKLQ
jgi:hypothetical protein